MSQIFIRNIKSENCVLQVVVKTGYTGGMLLVYGNLVSQIIVISTPTLYFQDTILLS
jgi:hypothetical protein